MIGNHINNMKVIKTIKNKKETVVDHESRRWSGPVEVLLHFLAALVGYYLIEAMARHSVSAAWTFFLSHEKVFLYNTMLIFLTSLPVFLFRRRVFLRVLTGSVWAIFGIANGIVLANRVTPLTGPDLMMLSEGLTVIRKYMPIWQIALIGAGIVVLLAGLVFFFLKAPVYRGKLRRIPVLIAILLSIAAGFGLTRQCIRDRILSTYFENIASAYHDYGFPYCLMVTVFDTGVSQPDRYSEKMINEILADEGKEKKTKKRGEELPNIIFVQCETFFDPTRVRQLSFSEDPLPNWHKLEKKYSSGLYRVPVVGAGTVNSEFETMTGMSLRFFGPGEYPYKGVLMDAPCESAAYVLKDLGLSTHAVHNNDAIFYRRNEVYRNLGFDTFTSCEYMENQDDVNEINWMRDRNLIDPINDALNSTPGRDFLLTVTVQPHGAYPSEWRLTDPAIRVSGARTEAQNAAWEYYVNQLHEEDAFVQALIDEMSARKEPTIILFYGDHLPTMNLTGDDLNKGSIYQTNYLIWDNMGLQRQKKNIAAYQAAAEIFKELKIYDGVMFRFQQTMQRSDSYTFDMQALQYDMLYGEKYVYGGKEPYSAVDMRMGVRKIELTSVLKVGQDMIYFTGKNFTPSCKVVIGDEVIEDTLYINDTTLVTRGEKIDPGENVSVGVRAKGSVREMLPGSDIYLFRGSSYALTVDQEAMTERNTAEGQTSSSS